MEKSYKERAVDSAIQGLIESGNPSYVAESFRKLLEIMYLTGYNEGLREQYISRKA